MSDYIITPKGLVSTDELMHARKGWTKPGAKYKKREWRNGHWVYYYDYGKKASQAQGDAKWYALRERVSKEAGLPNSEDFQKKMRNQSNKNYSDAESYKRMQNSQYAAEERKKNNSLSTKVNKLISKYSAKGKSFVDKVFSNLVTTTYTTKDLSTGKRRETKLRFKGI